MKWLQWLTFERGVQLLVILNVIDAASTHLLITLGAATEANPLMAWAYALGPDVFWVVKMTLVIAGLLLIGKVADPAVAQSIVMAANGLYFLVFLNHLSGWWNFYQTVSL